MVKNDTNEYLAEIYSRQAGEWMRTCQNKNRCPAGNLFEYLIAQQTKIDRLEHEIKRMQNFPDER